MIIAGLVLVVLGLVFFMQNTGFIPYDTWNNIWPILVVLIGLALMFTRRGYYGMKGWGRIGEGKMEGWKGWSGKEDHGMGSTESRAYGHEKGDGDKEQMHDKREDEM